MGEQENFKLFSWLESQIKTNEQLPTTYIGHELYSV